MRSIPLSNVLNLLTEMRRKSELFLEEMDLKTDLSLRQKLLEILNSGLYASPIIVFVNQKKTADMVAKDLSRAGVCFFIVIFKKKLKCIISVECSNIALWKKPRTTRSIITVFA